MKRVLHIQMTKSMGGIATVQKNLHTYIDREKYSFDFVTTYSDSALIPYAESLGARVFVLPPQKTVILYCIALYKLLKKENYDIIHIHKNSTANPMACIVAKLAGAKKIIMHSHNTGAISGKYADISHYIFRPLIRRIADKKVACSHEAGEWMFKNDSDVNVIYNGIDIEKYSFNPQIREDVREKISLSDKFVIGHVGNFILQKNHRFMIDVLERLIRIRPETVLLFIGRGPLMEDIKQYAESKNVSEHVRFMGTRDDVAQLYQAMDVFLFPSSYEGFGIAAVEAQSAGVPCVFSDVIIKDIIVIEKAVSLSLKTSVDEWAKTIIEISKEPQREENSIKMINSKFSAKQMAREMEKIYG